ncbi:MAG: M23 family metallopeptidase [Candidatus Cloacimonetes bacterium]|nr:M23 family metallopeptidase [Candidatus Cloacimonadota bacterium]
MALSKKWHIILSHTNGANLLNISLNKTVGLIVFALLGILFLGMLFSAAFIIRYHIYFPQIEQLQTENSLLRNELDKLVTEMDSVMYRLRQMEEWEDQLRLDRNIGQINRDLRSMGVGGLPQINTYFANSDHDLNLSINLVWNQMNELKGISTFAHELRRDLMDNLSLQEEMYRYTPSIYPTFGRITTPYGWRTHPITRQRDFHSGIDLANRPNSPIYTTADGVIKEISSNRYYGRFIVITHKFGYETMYAHLEKSLVKKGDIVQKGEIIALMGNTGRSTGTHLHYEVRRYGRNLNPYQYLNKMEEDIIITQQ